MVDDGILREALASGERTGPHVGEETWERLACGELSLEERERALDHASRCTPCGRVLRGLVLLEREAREFDPLVPAALSGAPEVRRWPPFRRAALVGAAAAAVAALVSIVVPSSRKPLPDSSAPGVEALRSAGEPDRPVPRSPRDEVLGRPEGFSWDATPAARAYRVELLDSEGESLWRSGEMSETSVPWPDEVPPNPGRYYWRVIAILADRGEAVASRLVSFDLKP
jgi:hypothetical protein